MDTAFYLPILNKNVFVNCIVIGTVLCFDLEEITKFCKLLAKKNVNLDYTGPQLIDFVGIVKKYNQLYNEKYDEYAARNSSLPKIPQKRKRDNLLVEVPLDPVERLNFFLAQASKLAQCGITASPTTSNNNATHSFSVGSSNLKNVLNYSSVSYRVITEDVTLSRYFTGSFATLKEEELNEKITTIAELLIDSVVKFNDAEVYVTSGDIFVHNNFNIDDCAYGLEINEVLDKPGAKVKALSYMGSSSYYEMSISYDFVKLLVTGGYCYREEPT